MSFLDDFYNNPKQSEASGKLIFQLDDRDDEKLLDFADEDHKLTIEWDQQKHTIDKRDVSNDVKKKVFGQVLLIPAVSDHSDETNISKTSTTISKLIAAINSPKLDDSLTKLNSQVNEYVTLLNKEAVNSIDSINKEIMFDGIQISIKRSPVDNKQIVKNNLKLNAYDSNQDVSVDVDSLGTGVQRNIVNSILLESNLAFNGFFLLLYDEPETFISASAQRKLMQRINEFSAQNNMQAIVATHSPDIIYRSKNIYSKVIRLKRTGKGDIRIYQFDMEAYKVSVDKTNDWLKDKVAEKYLLTQDINSSILALWDRNRVNALFEDKLAIVEGASEECFFDVAFMDQFIPYVSALGKFNFPYLRILFKDIFDIDLVAVFDGDLAKSEKHEVFNEYIEANFDKYVKFDTDLEAELGYSAKSGYNEKTRKLIEFILNLDNNKQVDRLREKILDAWRSS